MSRAFTVVPLIGTTNSSGDKVVVAAREVNGFLHSVHEDKGTLADGVDMTLAVIRSEMVQTVLTLTDANTDNKIFIPRIDSCGVTGAALTKNDSMIPVVGTLQLTIAQGGDTRLGGLYAYIIE